ncbi:MAG: hypothetical protein ABL982_09925 [Vicinamibacterales bacterium]
MERSKDEKPDVTAAETLKQLRRIANLLALIATKGEDQPDKMLSLTAAGFSNAEVGALLRTKPNTVAVTIYQAKRDGKRKKKRSSSRKRDDV